MLTGWGVRCAWVRMAAKRTRHFVAAGLMAQFAFYRVGPNVLDPLSVETADNIDIARTVARAVLAAENLDEVRIWVDGAKTVTIKRPVSRLTEARGRNADERGERMAALLAAGKTRKAVGTEFNVSKDRVRQIVARAERRASLKETEPNRAALSVRAQGILRFIIVEPEVDAAERDRLLPQRIAAVDRRDVLKAPNAGRRTINEFEVWLWERGLAFEE